MTATNSVLADDPAYRDLFSVEREVERHGGALLEDIYPRFAELRAQHGGVVAGSLHDLVGAGLPPGLFTVDRPHFATLDFDSTNKVTADGETYSIDSMFEYFPGVQLGRTILHMSGAEHRRHRGTVQPLFTVSRARDWWKPRWIEELVDALISDFEKDGRADNMHAIAGGTASISERRWQGLADKCPPRIAEDGGRHPPQPSGSNVPVVRCPISFLEKRASAFQGKRRRPRHDRRSGRPDAGDAAPSRASRSATGPWPT